MRADASTWMRRVVAPSVIVLALLASALTAACRIAIDPKLDPAPAVNAAVRAAEAAEIAALPDGPGRALLTERCLMCHGAALIAQQRKDAAAWGRTVTQMRTWGTPIQDEDQTALVAYLAEHFSPTLRARRGSGGRVGDEAATHK